MVRKTVLCPGLPYPRPCMAQEDLLLSSSPVETLENTLPSFPPVSASFPFLPRHRLIIGLQLSEAEGEHWG